MNFVTITDTDAQAIICVITNIDNDTALSRIKTALHEHYCIDDTDTMIIPDINLSHLVDFDVYKNITIEYSVDGIASSSNLEITKVFVY